jgi:4-hydroxy-2-oxoheptanedioate aldolase
VGRNPLLDKWQQDEVAYGAWLSIPSSFAAELVARQVPDYVCVDMQHGIVDYQVAVTMLQAINASGATPIVRVPSNDSGIIGKVLDAGAMGVIIPMVNSVADARAAVAACRYYPEGNRSFGPMRAIYSYGPDYYQYANAQVLCIPMIETKQAIEHIDDILSVPGINAIYVGPADLSVTLGLPPRLDNPDVLEKVAPDIATACTRHNIVAGIHATARLAAGHVKSGFRMITVSNDVSALVSGIMRDLKSIRE